MTRQGILDHCTVEVFLFQSNCLALNVSRKKQYIEEEVIEKAANVFWKQGYGATTVRELENEMGINQFSIYSSFGSKKGVFLKALSHYKSKVKKVFLAELIKSDGDIEDIREFFKGFVFSVKSGNTPNGCLMANTAMDMGAKDPEVKIQLQLYFVMLKDVFVEVLNKAKNKNQLKEDANVESYANYLLGCIQGLAVTAKVLDEEELHDFIDVAILSLK